MEKQKMVTGIFRDRANAEAATDYLHRLGYRDEEISVLLSDKTHTRFFGRGEEEPHHEAASRATEGMALGGALGTAVGSTIAALVAIGTTVALPGAGLVIAGPIAAALAGGGAGAVTGGILGSLVGAGMSKQNAEAYVETLRSGGIAIAVHPRSSDHATEIQNEFKRLKGENVCYC